MEAILNAILGFFNSFWGTIFKFVIDRVREWWKTAGTWVTGMVMAPLSWFIFGPMFKVTTYVMEKVMNMLRDNLSQDTVEMTGLASWFIGCLRIQECLSVIMSALALAVFISIIKKVF